MSRFQMMMLTLFVAVATVGCSGGHDYGPTGKITGTLKMDGKPLAPKTGVQFMEPIKGFLAFGETDDAGNFVIASWNDGQMPLGAYKVYLTPPPGTTTDPSSLTPEQRFDNPELVEPASRLQYPKKYADMNTSGLEYEVKAGDNHFDINIESSKKK